MESILPGIKRIDFLKVPVDIIPAEDLEEVFKHLADNGKKNQIVLINFFDLMRARRNKEYMKTLNEAALVIPTAKSIISGINFLKKGQAFRYRPFDFVIKALGVMESQKKSLYLMGGKTHSLQTVFSNMKISFPGLNIVGRYSGYYSAAMEENILLAIKKASPTFLLAGDGLKGKDRWLNRHKDSFNPGIFLWCSECYAIFSGKKAKGSKKSWENGTEVISEVLRNPLKIFRVFIRLYYLILLVIYRISSK